MRYDAPAPWVLAGDVPLARQLHDDFRALTGRSSYFMCFSGEGKHAYIATHGQMTLRAHDLTRLGVTEMHVVGRLQGKTLFTVMDEMHKDATIIFGNIEQ